jgi:hypothetical protein
MTTQAAAEAYAAAHCAEWNGRPLAVFNPHQKPIDELPVIYGFNNGGSPGWYSAELLAEDGTGLGGHTCSAECYMPYDLGCLEGSRPDRHKSFRTHYPDGYRMEFISGDVVEARSHEGLEKAYRLNQEKANGGSKGDANE